MNNYADIHNVNHVHVINVSLACHMKHMCNYADVWNISYIFFRNESQTCPTKQDDVA